MKFFLFVDVVTNCACCKRGNEQEGRYLRFSFSLSLSFSLFLSGKGAPFNEMASVASAGANPKTFTCDFKFTDVRQALLNRGWKLKRPVKSSGKGKGASKTSGGGVGFVWTNYRRIDFSSLLPTTYVNHLEGVTSLSVKSNLWENVKCKGGVRAPLTYVVRLSSDKRSVMKAFEEEGEKNKGKVGFKNAWIVKPSGLSRGRGIEVVDTVERLTASLKSATIPKPLVVQKYIANPCLLNGKKFDVRVWVAVLSVDPLVVRMFDKPYARLSSFDFTMEDVTNKFVHLTNNSVQSKAEDVLRTDDSAKRDAKIWSTDDMVEHFGKSAWEETVMPQFQSMSYKTVEAVAEKGHLKRFGRGFEMFGFDYMLDEELKVYLIEVNLDPDQSHSTKVTAAIVPEAIQGLIDLVLQDDQGEGENKKSARGGTWTPIS